MPPPSAGAAFGSGPARGRGSSPRSRPDVVIESVTAQEERAGAPRFHQAVHRPGRTRRRPPAISAPCVRRVIEHPGTETLAPVGGGHHDVSRSGGRIVRQRESGELIAATSIALEPEKRLWRPSCGSSSWVLPSHHRMARGPAAARVVDRPRHVECGARHRGAVLTTLSFRIATDDCANPNASFTPRWGPCHACCRARRCAVSAGGVTASSWFGQFGRHSSRWWRCAESISVAP